MLSYFNLNSRSEKTHDTMLKIPKGLDESVMAAVHLRKIADELEEVPESFAPVLVNKASNLVIDASRLAKDASGLVRNDATAKGYENLAEKVKSLSRNTLKIEDVVKSKDASGLVRDASGLARDASGLVRDASGLVRDAPRTTKETGTEKKLEQIAQGSEDLEKKARDLEKKGKTSRTFEEASSLVEDASKLIKDTSNVILVKHATLTKEKSLEAVDAFSSKQQVFMYLGVFIGVLFSAGVNQFRSGESITFGLTVGKFMMSAIIALITIPIVYEKLSLNPGKPFLYQFALFVQNGVFWNVLLNTVK